MFVSRGGGWGGGVEGVSCVTSWLRHVAPSFSDRDPQLSHSLFSSPTFGMLHSCLINNVKKYKLD